MRTSLLTTLTLSLACGIVAIADDPQAQTASQLLEAAIYAQETTGDLDAAATLYRRVLALPDDAARPLRADIAHAARRRLAETLHRKGDAASTAELAALAQQHPEVERLVRRLEEHAAAYVPDRRSALAEFERVERERVLNAANCCGLYSENYDPRRTFDADGIVTRVQWDGPVVVVFISGSDGRQWGITVGAPTALVWLGWTREALQPGDRIRAEGFYGKEGHANCSSSIPVEPCETFPDGARHVNARRIFAGGRRLFDRDELRKAAAMVFPAERAPDVPAR